MQNRYLHEGKEQEWIDEHIDKVVDEAQASPEKMEKLFVETLGRKDYIYKDAVRNCF